MKNYFTRISAVALTLVAVSTGLSLNTSAVIAAEWVQAIRVPYNKIQQEHPSFPNDTLLYFIDPPLPAKGSLDGMAMLDYGPSVSVKDWNEPARFKEYNALYLYYFDDQINPHEIVGNPKVSSSISPELPVNLSNDIRLEGYEILRSNIPRNTPIVLVLYWDALKNIEGDYGLEVQLVAPDGKKLIKSKHIPRFGQAPTQEWRAHQTIVDVVFVPIDQQIPVGTDYKIELVWHGLAQSPETPIFIEPFTIEDQ